MKLSEIKTLSESHHGDEEHFKLLDLWQDGASNLESADVDVEYDYEPPSYDDHPYGSTTAREHHGGFATVSAVLLSHDSKVYDDDGDKVVSTLKAGTDLMKQKWWKSSYTDWLEEKISDKINKHRDERDYD